MGKSLQEGLGEVQEMIDICDFVLDCLSSTVWFKYNSERPGHRMYEQYHPLGVVGIISVLIFLLFWNWNTAKLICGDTCVWKAQKNPLFVRSLVKTFGMKLKRK